MHAQQGRDSHQVREPHARSRRPVALSVAAQRCYRRVPCTPIMSVTHIKCTSLTREASTQLLSALQPNDAIVAPSATHAQHERDSPQVCLSHTRSQRPTALGGATQRCCRRVRCTPNASVPYIKCTSLTREASDQLPSALQRNVAIAEASAKHAHNERDSPQVRQPHKKPVPGCPQRCSAMSLSPRRMRCKLSTTVTHVECTSPPREAGAPPLSALQPNAAVTESHARSTRA